MNWFLIAAAAVSPGDCSTVFDQVVSATEQQYAGHVIKLREDDARATHARYRDLLRARAAQANDYVACREVLDAYVGFFADHHLFIASREHHVSPLPVLERGWTRAGAEAYFDRHAAALDAVEGFWYDADGPIAVVRGNAGGNAIYFPLAPYFLANDITIGNPTSVRASPWTLAYFEDFRKRQGTQGAWLDGPLARMRANPGEIVAYRETSTDGMPEYPARPVQVVVLQDRGVGSAAEAFVFHARQSRKVVTMGEPTRGNIDYMQVSMHEVGEGDYRYWFGYPLYFARSLPEGSIDDEGYAPDVRLTLPAAQWVDFAKAWLRAVPDNTAH